MSAFVQALILMVLSATLLCFAHSAPQVPCYFIFGDSSMDNGNNNHLVTTAKANYPPYGIDFPDGTTGRFSNGRNTADVVAQLLGFENFIPPFATARHEEIVRGVNYASGAAGIRDETAEHMGGRICMNRQLTNHAITILRLVNLIGNGSLAKARQHLNKCIYTVAMGNNDYINNYFYPKYYQTSILYTPDQYAKILIKQYSKQLSKLYKYGARKFGIAGAGYIGCTPAMMNRFNTNKCVDAVNGAIIQFNTRLVTAIGELESKLSDSKFIFIDPPRGYSSGSHAVTPRHEAKFYVCSGGLIVQKKQPKINLGWRNEGGSRGNKGDLGAGIGMLIISGARVGMGKGKVGGCTSRPVCPR
ncbi:unnamed protein product [Lactuca saligna]|uniref:GDSL esterase/lipase n=1 Tax=Lactuca saligna TaxID=75948 RepID=A0AA35VNX9_LACSI|nr:unnamed protein product [Lactuca saligna]